MSDHFAVKRITSELKDQHKNPSVNFCAEPLENDMFDWHFTLRGPKDSVYQDGIYHGRLILPLNYPLKPPKFLMFNHSGRFEVGREICMSNTSFHPDEWQPAWTIRTMLEGLVSFFPEETEGAVGALKASDEARKVLALSSWNWSCPVCGKLAEVWKGHMSKFPEIEFRVPSEIKEEVKEKEENKNPDEIKEEEKADRPEEEKAGRPEEEKRQENRRENQPKLPSEEEVRRYVGYVNRRIFMSEVAIVGLILFMIASNFFPGISNLIN